MTSILIGIEDRAIEVGSKSHSHPFETQLVMHSDIVTGPVKKKLIKLQTGINIISCELFF